VVSLTSSKSSASSHPAPQKLRELFERSCKQTLADSVIPSNMFVGSTAMYIVKYAPSSS
jgi:hypothetical protein